MRYLVLLSFLLAGCETFGWGEMFGGGENGTVQDNRFYCNAPQRLRVLRTTAEVCRHLGGHRVDASRVDLLELEYQDKTMGE